MALSNRAENGLKYSPSDSVVNVSLNKTGHKATLKIADQGPGIAEGEKERIFGKFYRIGNEETRATKGTGLGLFIVKQVLENNGPEMNVKDNKTNGNVL